jgi:hypothetical protein
LKTETNFGCAASLTTLDKLVDRFPQPPAAPPIGNTSLTHEACGTNKSKFSIKIDLMQKLSNIFRNGLQILILYAISHILMQRFKHDFFLNSFLEIQSRTKKKVGRVLLRNLTKIELSKPGLL